MCMWQLCGISPRFNCFCRGFDIYEYKRVSSPYGSFVLRFVPVLNLSVTHHHKLTCVRATDLWRHVFWLISTTVVVKFAALFLSTLWRWKQKVPPKYEHVSIELREATYHKTVTFACTVMTASFSQTAFISSSLPGRMPVGARFCAHVRRGPGAHPASCTMDIGSLSQGQSGRGVALTAHHHLAPRLMQE